MNGGKNVTLEVPKPVIIKERITRKLLRPVMAQFSSLSEALLELVDNAFDEFDGFHGGKHLYIDIYITKHSIRIENLGGKGMGQNELSQWLYWGDPHKSGAIGEYGQGGKAAMGYIGSSCIIQSKRYDEPWLWEIKDDKWDDVTGGEKSYKAVPQKDEINQGDIARTTSLGGKFPKNILVGEIASIRKNDAESFQEGTIIPYFTPTSLSRLFLVTNFNQLENE